MADVRRCSFCERSEHEVCKLVAGAGGGFICDECVAIAARIIADSDPETRGFGRRMRALLRRLASRFAPGAAPRLAHGASAR